MYVVQPSMSGHGTNSHEGLESSCLEILWALGPSVEIVGALRPFLEVLGLSLSPLFPGS